MCESCLCAKNTSCVIWWSCSMVIFMVLSVAGALVLLSGQGEVDCRLAGESLMYAARGGNLTFFHENTVEAIEAAVADGLSPEFDVFPASDGEPVLFHDRTLDRLTDESGLVFERSAGELQAIPIVAEYDGLSYNSTGRIATLNDALIIMCVNEGTVNGNPETPFYVDVKIRSTGIFPAEEDHEFARLVVQRVASSQCESDRIIFGTEHPLIAQTMQDELSAQDMNERALVSLSLPPGSIPGGMLWLLRTRYLLNGIGLSHTTTMVDTHRVAYVESFDVMSSLQQDGYCTGVFGGSMVQLTEASGGEPTVLQVEIPGSPNGYGGDNGGVVEYEPQTITYDALLGGTIGAGVVFLTSIVLVALCGHRCRTDPSERDRACCCACCFRDDEDEEDALYLQDPYHDDDSRYSKRDDTYHSSNGYTNGYSDVQMSKRNSRVPTGQSFPEEVDDYYSDY